MSKLIILIKKRFFLILIFVGIALGIFYYYKSQYDLTSTSTSYKVKSELISESLSISGEIDAEERALITFQTGGRLSWVGVKEGDTVKKGSYIASLDQRELKKKLDRYLNLFMKSRIDFDQSRDDVEDKAVTDAMQRILDKYQYDLNNSVIDVELVDLSMQFANLSSPIDGVVVRVDTPYAGVNIVPSQSVFEVINPETLYFTALVDQTEVSLIKPGLQGDITLDAYPDEILKGEVNSVSFTPKIDETGTVYETKIKLMNGKNDFKIGMTGDVTFDLGAKERLVLVPTVFINSENGETYVWKKEGSKKVKKVVTTGEAFDDKTEIVSGLTEGDIIYD